jgi:nicotinate-nucleotide adenylyltransferase
MSDGREAPNPDSAAPEAAAIGLLGGSFDPVHVGHLQLARDAVEQLGLSELRFVPAAQPWQKAPLTDSAHRAHMIVLAIGTEPRFVLDLREIERGGASYTIDTLRELRGQLGAAVPIVLVLGADQIERLDTWRDWRALLEYAHIAVARRNDAVITLNDALQTYYNEHWARRDGVRQRPCGHVVEIDMRPVAASATAIRALLREAPAPQRDARLAASVPGAVLDYIRTHHLYR